MKTSDKTVVMKRKRGVIASRFQLEKALQNTGIKTQSALASKIAEIENINTPPKDLVNKVFREKSVSHSSIQRLANALQVEAYTLYQTQKEVSYSENTADVVLVESENELSESQQPSKNNVIRKAVIGSIFSITVILIFSFYLYQDGEARLNSSPTHYIEHDTLFPDSENKLGRDSIVILWDERSQHLYKELEGILSKSVNVLPAISSEISRMKEQSAEDIISSLGVDYVLTLSNLKKGRYQYHSARLNSAAQEHLIWSMFSTLAEFNVDKNKILNKLDNAVMQALGLTEPTLLLPTDDLTQIATLYYLEGLDLLDGSQNQLNVKSAQSRFTNVIRYAPDFAQAYAGLCESLLLESWTSNEKEVIKSAQPFCEKAVELLPENNHVVAAQSLFLRKTGRVKEAIELLHNKIESSPFAINIHTSAAYAEYDAFNQYPENSTFLEHAKSHVSEAIKFDQKYWKPYFVLGLINWASGDIDAALEATKKAYEINENELILTNLGILSMCVGDISAAQYYFSESVAASPDSHLGYEMLGQIHFYNKRFEQSIESRLHAIKNAGSASVHQIWGDLADSYYEIQDTDNAIKNYQKALTIIESDMALGNIIASDKAQQVYYLHRLSLLNRQDKDLARLVENELITFDLAPSELSSPAKAKLAITYFEVDNLQEAENYLRLSLHVCPLYAQHPNIVEFAKTLNLGKADFN